MMTTHSVEVSPQAAQAIPQTDHFGHAHPEYLAHHFDSMSQQFAAGKLGMWIFLVTEILFFGGLFCAYAVYRANHPEIFVYAHQFLDKDLGALNTAILIFSSFTMAWAVRAAQLDQQRILQICLAITLLCAAAFMGVKYVEYRQKWEHGLLWAGMYKPHGKESAEAHDGQEEETTHSASASPAEQSSDKHAPQFTGEPRLAGVFFSIYFCMTGLHALHVLGGMVVITWLLVRSFQGVFGSHYFGPVDYVGLYWHLVDMIWIFLFPLLYLIH